MILPTKQPEYEFVCFFHGMCEPRNPGGAMGIGAAIFHDGEKDLAFSDFRKENRWNNNHIAAYLAFEKLMDFLISKVSMENATCIIYGTSELVIKQMQGWWQIKKGHYVEIARDCKGKYLTLQQMRNKIKLQIAGPKQIEFTVKLSKLELVNRGIHIHSETNYAQ